jgi:cyclohexadienyl dehydratase
VAAAQRLFLVIMLVLSGTPRAAAQGLPRLTDPAADVERVFALLAERLALMPAVAAWKWERQAPIIDPARERELLRRAAEDAASAGLDADSVRSLLDLQMQLARAVQERHFARWQAHGFAAARAQDLNTVLRPRLDSLGEALLSALALAAPQLALGDFRQRYAARAARVLRDAGLPEARAGRLLEALSSVRAPPEGRLKRVLASKVLRIGTPADYAPFSVEVDGALHGADIALASAFAASLGVVPRFVRSSWPALLADYAGDAFDIALGGISVTPERARAARFSLPYQSGGKTPLSRCSERRRFASLAAIDRAGVRVVVNPGGTNEAFVREHLRAASIRVFPDNRAIFGELVAARADVMITDDVEAELQHRLHPELCRTSRATFTRAQKAWLVQPDAALLARVDAWLGQRVKERTVARLIEQELAKAAGQDRASR